MNPMKTALISVLTATLLGMAYFTSGRQFDAADFTACFFTIGLVAWTMAQYGRVSRPINLDRPVRFPASARLARLNVPAARLAA